MEIPNNPIKALRELVSKWPEAGDVGVVVGRPGLGKSTLLTHLSLDAVLASVKVYHVGIGSRVEQIQAHYDEVLRELGADAAAGTVLAERNRMIHTSSVFDAERLGMQLDMLARAASFTPSVLLLDGLSSQDNVIPVLRELTTLAAHRQLIVWVGVSSERKLNLMEEAGVATVVRLTEESGALRLVADAKGGGLVSSDISLDPSNLVVQTARSQDELSPSSCTLHSGGARGSEAAFGAVAASYRMSEVNFTFEGHLQERKTGSYQLSPAELAAGDVSLGYVSKRLNRAYSNKGMIRGVLQTLWHMVSRSQQVFVIGEIQDDYTVQGGTGWSVELAKTWGRELWVFDQNQQGWYRWDADSWVPGEPVIQTASIAGTGTRKPTKEALEAISDLFKRSFG